MMSDMAGRKIKYICFLTGILSLAIYFPGMSQVGAPSAQPTADSTNIIHLLNADVLMGIQPSKTDSSQLQKLIGNVLLRQGQTFFSCDSALQNLTTNTIDAYGHIHINQADTINTYADFLHYEGNTKVATLRQNVRMTDDQMTLTTNLLDYNMDTHIGSYLKGGKLINKTTTLTSERGYYYADTKDVYFKTNVQLVDPEYTLATDTLLYNTNTRIATFQAPTTINTGRSIIHTACGYYSTVENYAHLCDRSMIIDSSRQLTADSMNYTKGTGIGIAYGNVVWTDTAHQMTLLANYAISNQNKKTVMATQKPLLILSREKDTLYTAADTLFSGVLPPPTATDSQQMHGIETGAIDAAGMTSDSLHGIKKDSVSGYPGLPLSSDSTRRIIGSSETTIDSIHKIKKEALPIHRENISSDSLGYTIDTTSIPIDSLHKIKEHDLANVRNTSGNDSLTSPPDTTRPSIDSLIKEKREDMSTNHIASVDSMPHPIALMNPPLPDSAAHSKRTLAHAADTSLARDTNSMSDTTEMRYIIAYHHVRLFSDSLQAVADSLYYSDVDSAFHFYTDPVLWTGETQLTADTIVLFSKNQQADRLLLQQHAMIINQPAKGVYNQIKGSIITGYFKKDNELDWMDVNGNAEYMYYAQDDNGAFVGGNHSTSAGIHIYFKDSKLFKVVPYKNVDGTFTNPAKISLEDRELKGFKWEADRRPQSKAELME